MAILSQHLSALSCLCPKLLINEPMKAHTSFRIGGPADAVAFPQNRQEMLSLLEWHGQNAPDLPLCVLGRGSNVLFDDDGFPGLVIITTDIQDITVTPKTEDLYTVTASCGASLTGLAKLCGKHIPALKGLSFACGIPGSVGGAVVMNAGAYGGEMSDVLVSVDYFDTQTKTVRTAHKEELALSYRHSVFQDNPHYIVLSATLEMNVGDGEIIQAEMKKNLDARQDKQPLTLPNAGSVFKRPEGAFVGKMVEECGLKGYTVGGAQVSTKHAGFIVNVNDATCADVLSLIQHIKDVIFATYGITLICEIKYIPSTM